MQLARILEDARQQAKLSAAVMSSMVGIDEARLRQLEAGEDEPTAVELDTYARVFGLRMAELVGGQVTGAPLTRMLFRSASEGGLDALNELIARDGHLLIGDFMRFIRDIHELEGRLGLPAAPPLPEPPEALRALDPDVPPHGGDKLAEWLRAELGLGLEPIGSLIELVIKTLGIRVLWATPDGDKPPPWISTAPPPCFHGQPSW